MESNVCNRKTEVYSRVTGYFRPINNWNPGKQEEFSERITFNGERALIQDLKTKPVQTKLVQVE